MAEVDLRGFALPAVDQDDVPSGCERVILHGLVPGRGWCCLRATVTHDVARELVDGGRRSHGKPYEQLKKIGDEIEGFLKPN